MSEEEISYSFTKRRTVDGKEYYPPIPPIELEKSDEVITRGISSIKEIAELERAVRMVAEGLDGDVLDEREAEQYRRENGVSLT